MNTFVGLLRAVNVGGRGKVAMSDLRDCLMALGCSGARTLLQSGNVVFQAHDRAGPKLQECLQTGLLERLGLRTEVMVRSEAQWKELLAGNPFEDEAKHDPGHLLAMVSKRPVSTKAFGALRAAVQAAGGRETARESGGQVYLYFPDGIGRSRVTTALVERALGTSVTGRNWNTVLKLAEACESFR